MRVGIVGMGVIGTAQAEMFRGHDVVVYDSQDHKAYPITAMSKVDFALICVGTPERLDGRADLRYVAQAVNELPGGVPVAIRSTVPPGTTDRLLSNRLYAHVPEFMGENVLHSLRCSPARSTHAQRGKRNWRSTRRTCIGRHG
jgi:UDP-glucose 6-dehydrogenase